MRTRQLYFLALVGTSAIVVLPALLTKASFGPVYFDSASAAIAGTIGDIVGPILSFLTLIVVFITYRQDTQEKNFRQALDLISTLVELYSTSVRQYQEVGKKQGFFVFQGRITNGPGIGRIISYAVAPAPLFNVVIAHIEDGNLSDLQAKALSAVLVPQIEPLIRTMQDEIEEWKRNNQLDLPAETKIINQQLVAVTKLIEST